MSVIQVPGTFQPAYSAVDTQPINEQQNPSDDVTGLDLPASMRGSQVSMESSVDVPMGRGGSEISPPDVQLARAEKLVTNLAANGKPEEALRELIRCTALAALVYGPNHWRYAESYANLAQGYLDLKGTSFAQQGEQHSEFARTVLLTGTQSSSVGSETEKVGKLQTVITTYHALARSQALLKKFQEAEASINKAISVLNELSRISAVSEEHVVKSRIKLRMSAAKICARLEKPAVAGSHYEAALDTAIRQYGSGHKDLIPIYQALGQLEQSKGSYANHERAIDQYLEAHTISIKNHHESSPEVAETARALAIAYSKTGDSANETSSESYLNECISIYTSLYGPKHATVCQVQNDLARLFIRTERQEEGIKLLRRNIQAEAAVHGEFSDQVLDSRKLIGSTLLSQADMEAALKEFNKCLQIEELVHGPNSKKAKQTKQVIDKILAHPSLASKQVGFDLKNRPRFNNVSRTKTDRTGVFS